MSTIPVQNDKKRGANDIVLDIIICILTAAILGYTLAEFNFFEQVYEYIRETEGSKFDNIFMLFLFSPIYIAYFSYRRITELRREIEARALAEEQNLKLARTDALTDLPNRRCLNDELTRRAARCARHGGTLTVMHVDLDRFKQVNDTLGHTAGDQVLVHVARLLQSNLRRGDFIARVGGDEFVMILDNCANRRQLQALANRLIESLKQPIGYNGEACYVGASIGISIAAARPSGEEIDPKRLMTSADIALHRAKDRGRGCCEFYTEDLRSKFEETKLVSDEVLIAIDREEFFPVYQLQFDAKTHDVVGAEALARWRHPKRRAVSPDKFFAVAEFLNVAAEIDNIILKKVLADVANWSAADFACGNISVNVCSQRIHDGRLIQRLRELNIPPGLISFELTESIYFDNYDEQIRSNVEALKQLGFEIEIDDFGTGHASIVSLTKLNPRRLKIDRALIAPIVESRSQRRLVQVMINMGKSLGIDVTAEGVETMEHAAILRDLGCDVLQGFAFARPMPAAELAAFVSGQAWRKVA